MTTLLQSDSSVVFWINQDGTSDAGDSVQVQKHSGTPEVIMKVFESGAWEVYGPVSRQGAHEFRNTGASSTIVQWKRAGTSRLEMFYDGSISSAGIKQPQAGDDLLLRSADGFNVVLDHDNDAGGPSYFKVKNGSGNVVFQVGNDHSVTLRDGSVEMLIWSYDRNNGNVGLDVGVDSSLRGIVRVRRGFSGGSDNTASLRLEREDQASRYLFFDTTGDLRIHTADPGSDDTVGSVVGNQ